MGWEGEKEKKKRESKTLQDKDQYYIMKSLAWNKNTYVLHNF